MHNMICKNYLLRGGVHSSECETLLRDFVLLDGEQTLIAFTLGSRLPARWQYSIDCVDHR